MFKRTRKVLCPECNGSNFWNANPRFTDVLHCRYCHTKITTYEKYVESTAQEEAQRLLAEFTEIDVSQDLSHLKAILSTPEHRSSL